MKKHLDLGCGNKPRNPYGREKLYGIDIAARSDPESGAEIMAANLATQKIPFGDNSFQSVSAFDFLEHIPRAALDYRQDIVRFPFIELMSEIWRVLDDGGLLYAVTPAYPRTKAFTDPTHVNFITRKTVRYFTGAQPMGRMYGFVGEFALVRQQWVHPRGAYEPTGFSLLRSLRNLGERIAGEQSHLLWELRAVKRGSGSPR